MVDSTDVEKKRKIVGGFGGILGGKRKNGGPGNEGPLGRGTLGGDGGNRNIAHAGV